MYQTPFKIKAETIQMISDIASLQALHTEYGTGRKASPAIILKENFAGLEFRHGYGAGRIPFLVQDLVEWADRAKDHILIKGCVVLYELETLNPFECGDSKLAVKCLKDLLGIWNPVFGSIPLEGMISGDIGRYRRSLAISNDSGDSGFFITYMLGLILVGLKKVKVNGVKIKSCDPLNDLLKYIQTKPEATYIELAAKLSVSPATIKRRIAELKKTGVIKRVGSKKTGSWQILRSDQ